ncbi:MAG: BON domain-containing protein [Gammaproteobacteria bacterium]|jgi:osmotically-inducible protein OsmY|nr:BON domain-containing protein [Gammaproteobacteria bacterium]MBT3859939.1 BON domain-containing protein [Gammaproteobacteria bacterium]MBT3986401.1 BON domain-containing protein [Gammaproteobacteria bacterium]MBT4254678.1 BON domain-containing protein [Gammaproteobacteria bacterium]MBT4582961.1 BON domain-containing protein [Gammaproteobacteria bacterium]
MKLRHFLLITLMLVTTSCTSILVRTTGGQGIEEDPTERTAGAVVEDQSIETKIAVNLRSFEPDFRQANVQVVSHNGVVLLIGQVGSENLKSRATEISAEASTKIKRIHNELEVAGQTSLISRSNDTWIATKVRTLMLANSEIPSSQVRVIAENGAIFLMGLINQAEGDNAANLARNVSGVTKVVKVFEYVN